MSDNAREIFAKNFAYLLDKRGRTQIDVARSLDVATGTVSSWANGLKYPRVDKMQRIADYLGVRMSILVEENGIDVFAKEEDERRLVDAYRAADPGIKASVRKLLDIPEEQKGSDIEKKAM